MFNRKLFYCAIAFLIVMYLLNYRLTEPKKSSSSHWTVYGTNGCGWTRKQLKHMKDNGVSHTFVDCDKEDCGDVKAYPTLKDSNGKVITGFSLVH